MKFSHLAVFAMLTACGSNVSGGGTNTTTLTPQNFQSAYLQTVCSALYRCPLVNDNALAAALLGNPTACVERAGRLGLGNLSDLLTAVNEGTVRFDSAAASACLSRISATCAFESDIANICRDVFVGTVAAGGMCWRAEQCARGTFCDHGDGPMRLCPGACAAQRAAGGPCGVDRQCLGYESGAVACVNGMCAAVQTGPTASAGQPCGLLDGPPASRVACAAGLVCRGQRCLTPVAAGAPCASGDVCAPGNVCVAAVGSTQRTCTSPAPLVTNTAGGSCSTGSRMPPICNPLTRLTCMGGTCVSLGNGEIGSSCITGGDFNSATCNPGFRCDSTTRTCQPRRPAGEMCEDDSDCLSDQCIGMRCLARVCN